MVRRTKADAEATRHQILDAAEGVFRQQGVSRTSLQDVAAAAGVTRGAIYWHFKDKAEVFMAMMDRVCLPCETAAELAARDGATCSAPPAQAGSGPLQRLADMALQPLRDLHDDPHVRQVFYIAMHCTEFTDDLAPARARRLEAVQGYQQLMVDVLAEAQAQGEVPATLALAPAAAGLFALVDGLLRNGTLAEAGFDLTVVGPLAVNAYIDGLRGRSSPTASAPAAPGKSRQKSPARPAPST